jgi:hypothetical protein
MNEYIEKKCEYCENIMKLKIITQNCKNKGDIISRDKNKRFCCTKCQIEWQRKVKWEDRVGEKKATIIRENRRKQLLENNPSKNYDIKKKISDSLKEYLKENSRIDEKNPFFGKHHTDEYKKNSSKNKKGIRSYNDEQYEKQKLLTPKGENHPNWGGWSSLIPYSKEFTKELKNKIKKRDNNLCSICNKERKLTIHHIDYDKKNSNEKNLISLCISCHSKTNYNREYWINLLNEKIKILYMIIKIKINLKKERKKL